MYNLHNLHIQSINILLQLYFKIFLLDALCGNTPMTCTVFKIENIFKRCFVYV